MPTIDTRVKKAKREKREGGKKSPLLGISLSPRSTSGPAGQQDSEPVKKKSLLEKKRIRTQQVLFFTRQLLTLYKAGIPIGEGLETIAAHESHPELKKILFEMKRDVEAGLSISEAMRKYPRAFSHFYTGVVEGGEKHGVLAPLLERLVHYMENEENVRRSIKSALRYPLFVLITLALAFVVIMAFIFPRFQPLFAKFGGNLPLLTQVLLAVSSILRNQWIFLLGGIFAAAALYTAGKRFKPFCEFVDRLKIRIPLLGRVYQYAVISRFANMFSTFFSGGMVNILNILKLIEKAFKNVTVRKEISRLSEGITNGRSLGDLLEEDSRLFPPLFAHLARVGEKTGEMESMMNVLYEHYEQDLRYRTQRLISVIEPIMLFVTSGCILVIALGIFMPYWRLMEVYK